MALKNYVLNGPSVVILDDARDPHVSWQNHLERTEGKRGGVDLVAAVGTPVYAPTDGVMDWRKNDGSAGNSCRFVHDDNKGWKDVFSHLSTYVGKDMQRFKQGELIAHSGNSGGVTQHLHRHLLDPDDVRQNPWDHFSSSAPAGGTATPLAPIAQEDDMITRELVQSKTGSEGIFYSVNRIQRLHVPDSKTLKDYQYHLDGLAAAGDRGAVGAVQVVDNLNAFGVIVK